MTRSREATRRGAGGRVEWTNATDESGILVPLSSYDIERLDRESIDAYKEKREQQIAGQEEKAREQDAKRRFTEAFVAAGGTKADAESAWRLHRNEQAAEAAATVDREAIRRTRSRVRSRL